MNNQGIIISNISSTYTIEILDTNLLLKCSARGKFKEKNITPTVGDIVNVSVIDQERKEGVIDSLSERNSYLKRPKIANVTQIILVISMKTPKPDLLMLDKQLAFAEFCNIRPIICINKIDLSNEMEIDSIANVYEAIGYKTIKTDCKSGKGIDDVKSILKNNVTAFAGNSGVGKSTLINCIFSNELTREGSISTKSKKGKNTTTNTYLYKIDQNSYIADTPGFSTFDICEIKSENLYKYFIEFYEEAHNCEFVGCTHIKEEKCGIKQAIKLGKISNDRYKRFCKIYSELKEKEEHIW